MNSAMKKYPKAILYMDWYENGVSCEADLDFPSHLQMEIRIDGDLEYAWCIDHISYEEAYELYDKTVNVDDCGFDDVIFRKIFP